MASVSKRADTGKWVVRYRDPAGRQRAKSFRRKVDAERFRSEVETDKSRGAWVDPRHGQLTFGEWWGQYFPSYRSTLRPTTAAQVESVADSLVLDYFKSMALVSIKQREVQAWVTRLHQKGGKRRAPLAPSTVRKAYQVFTRAMGAAVDAEMIAKSPCRGIALPADHREETRFLTAGQVATLADAVDPRYRALVLVAAYGGLRIGELAGLRVSRVDVLRGRVTVAETLVEVKGQLVTSDPKTAAGRRIVPLPRPVAEEVGAHIGRWGLGPDDHLFPAPDGGLLRVPTWRRRFWYPAVERAGLAPEGGRKLRIHDLRHTAVALWIATGANPKQISVRAGHTSVAFTLDRYGHLFEDDDERMTDRLAAMYVPTSGSA